MPLRGITWLCYLQCYHTDAIALLKEAQEVQAKYYNQGYTLQVFYPGDWILLSTKHLNLQCLSWKLAKKYKGPFPVEQVVGQYRLIYYLILPLQIYIHPIFPMSLLEPYQMREGEKPEIPTDIEFLSKPIYKVERILAYKGKGKQHRYYTQWKGYLLEESIQEPQKSFDDREMIQEYKALAARGGGNEGPGEIEEYCRWIHISQARHALEGALDSIA